MKWIIAFAASVAGVSPWIANNPHWYAPSEPFHVIDQVYYVGTKGLASWLIRTPKGHILIDGGAPENAPLIAANIKALGFQLSDVKILLNSHAHFDHAGGLAALKAESGAKLYASAADRPALEHGNYAGSEDEHSFDFPRVAVDKVIRDGERVSLGGVTLTTVLTPGHSPGCTSFEMTVRDQGKPHRAFFFCSATVAANRLAPHPQFPGIVADYRRTFARLKRVKADVFLGPHGEFFGLEAKRAAIAPGAPNPFIVAGEAQRVFAAMEASFVKQLAEQQAKAVR
jgi:metallo-beta-lactamase class B